MRCSSPLVGPHQDLVVAGMPWHIIHLHTIIIIIIIIIIMAMGIQTGLGHLGHRGLGGEMGWGWSQIVE